MDSGWKLKLFRFYCGEISQGLDQFLILCTSVVRQNCWSKSIILSHWTKISTRNIISIADKPGIFFNERFEWAWGTKNSMEDGSNVYKRTLEHAVRKGVPLPIQNIAEIFETDGTLGAASAGIGVHEAGFYAHLFLTWVETVRRFFGYCLWPFLYQIKVEIWGARLI